MVLGVFDELADHPGTYSGAVQAVELFGITGGVVGGVDDLAAQATVAAHIRLGLLSVGNPVLLVSSASQEESHHQEPEDDNLSRRPGQSGAQWGQFYSPAGAGRE